MRQFGFIIGMLQGNTFRVHNKIEVKHQGGGAEYLTKVKSTGTLEKYMVENETSKNKWVKNKI